MAIFYKEAEVDGNGAEEVNLRTSTGVELLGQTSSSGSIPVVIASDQTVNVQPIWTYQAGQQKVYNVSLDINLASTGEKMMLYFRNPNASGKVIKLIDLTAGITNTVSCEVILRIYANPTVTANGTAVTVRPAYIGGSQPAGVSLLTSIPTVTANGIQYFSIQLGGGPNSSSSHYDFDEALILAANNSLLITGNPDGINRNTTLTLRWVEV